MSAESRQVLEMLTEGKISVQDAERLLDKLGNGRASVAGVSSAPPDASEAAGAGAEKPRWLRILVEKPGHETINMRLPLSLVRSSRVMAMVPPRVRDRLAEQGFDLGRFATMKELAEALETTGIDIEKGNGKRVRIFCE